MEAVGAVSLRVQTSWWHLPVASLGLVENSQCHSSTCELMQLCLPHGGDPEPAGDRTHFLGECTGAAGHHLPGLCHAPPGPGNLFPKGLLHQPHRDSDHQPGLGAPEFNKLHKLFFFFFNSISIKYLLLFFVKCNMDLKSTLIGCISKKNHCQLNHDMPSIARCISLKMLKCKKCVSEFIRNVCARRGFGTAGAGATDRSGIQFFASRSQPVRVETATKQIQSQAPEQVPLGVGEGAV